MKQGAQGESYDAELIGCKPPRAHPEPVNEVTTGPEAWIGSRPHRAIKRRVKGKLGFRELHAARRTIQRYEAMHMTRKGVARWVSGSDLRQQIAPQGVHAISDQWCRVSCRPTR